MKLIRANVNDCEKIWKIQTEAFSDLLERYQDYETSPGNEAKERIEAKLSQEFTYFYYIFNGDDLVGAIRVVDKKDGSRKRIAPVFVMKEFRNKGLAQYPLSGKSAALGWRRPGPRPPASRAGACSCQPAAR